MHFYFKLLFAIVYLAITYAKSAVRNSKIAVVIGGGPTGITTCLMLQKRGWETTLIEKVEEFKTDNQKSYLYLIDGRSQKILNPFKLTEILAKESVPNSMFTKLMELGLDGSKKILNIPIPKSTTVEKYWIPRARFLNTLLNHAKNAHKVSSDMKPIQMMFGTRCINLEPCLNNNNNSNECQFKVTCASDMNENKKTILHANLIVACDGINSSVRKLLSNYSYVLPSPTTTSNISNDNHQYTITHNIQSGDFELTSYASDAAGLNYKMLTINGALLNETATQALAIKGTGTGRNNRMRLGLLPVKLYSERTANIIGPSSHMIWKIKNVTELITFLQQSFPQLSPIEKYFNTTEMDSFVKTTPGVFPNPQHVNKLTALFTPKNTQTEIPSSSIISSSSQQNASAAAAAGVVILGDAAHAFPPDLGQGVNSGLEDVYIFQQTLEECQDNLQTALPLYEKRRYNDIVAICKLVSFGFPYQYNHAPIKKNIRLITIAARLLLNKLAPILFHPPAFMLVGDHTLSYTEVLRRAHVTTFRIIMMSVMISMAVMLKTVPFLRTSFVDLIWKPLLALF